LPSEPNPGPGIYDSSFEKVGPMIALLEKFHRWFRSFDEEDEPPRIVVKTPEDGARMGMIGWY
jgi:hypothetical protein